MGKILPWSFLFAGLISLMITFTNGEEKDLTEYQFQICLSYDFCFANFNFPKIFFQLFLIFYFALIAIIAFRKNAKKKFERVTTIVTCFFLSFPLLFFSYLNQYPLNVTSYWEKIFPFYTMPQNYYYIAVDCIRFLNILIILNLIFFLYFVSSNKHNST